MKTLEKLQRNAIRQYVSLGFKLCAKLDTVNTKLSAHLNNMSWTYEPIVDGMTQRQFDRLFENPVTQELDDFSYGQFKRVQKIRPELTEEQFMKMTDLTNAECECPPRATNTSAFSHQKKSACECRKAFDEAVANDYNPESVVTVFVPNKTKEARDAFNKAELEVALEGMHAAKPEIYSEDIQDELGDKLLNFGEELRKQVLECTEPIDSSVIQKVENGLRDIREAKLLSTHNSQTRCRCGRQGSKHNLQIKSVESPLPTVDELRSAILEPLPSAEYVMPDLTAKEGRFKYLQDLASGKFDPLKVEEDVRVECKSGVRPSLMTEFDVKNEAKLFRAQHIVDDMVLRGLICGDEDSIQTQIDQIVSWPDEYVDTFEEGIKQFNGVKAGVFKKAE